MPVRRLPAAIGVLTLACRAGPPATNGPGHPSEQTDVSCQDLGQVSFGRPQEWTVVSQDFLDYLDWLQTSPNRADQGGKPANWVRDLATFDGRLYIGIGDWGFNTGSLYCAALGDHCPFEDAAGHGLPVFSYGPGDEAASWDFIAREEELSRFRRTGDALIIPSLDPTGGDGTPACARENADPACPEEVGREHPKYQIGHYTRLQDGAWSQAPLLEGALHMLDLAVWQGTLYAVGSGQPYDRNDPNGSYAVVWRSDDDGLSWTLDQIDQADDHKRRWTGALPLDDGVIVFGRWFTEPEDTAIRQVQLGQGWQRQDDAMPGLVEIGDVQVFDGQRGLVWEKPALPGGSPRARQVWLEDGRIQDAGLPALEDEGLILVDTWLLCEGDLLTLSRRWQSDGTWLAAVHRTQDLESFDLLLSWAMDRQVHSLALFEGDLIIGSDDGVLLRSVAGQP